MEADYWSHLEYRVCRELEGMPEKHLRQLWCDGFIPENYLLDDPTPRIIGRAWIGNGPGQEEWAFTLFLAHPVGSRDEIKWAALLPGEDMTRWIALDRLGKHLQMDPLAAVPDSA